MRVRREHSSTRSRLKRRGSLAAQGKTIWMISFSDLLTLLFAFFVLRVAMASLEKVSLAELPAEAGDSLSETISENKKATEALTEKLKRVLEEAQYPIQSEERINRIRHSLRVISTDNGTLLMLPGATFSPASDELSSQAAASLADIARVLANLTLDIEIVGHTDNVPIDTERFRSNWELSTSRSIAVARIIMAEGIPGTAISVVGYADTKPRSDNSTDEGRAANRRVEVYFRSRG